MSRHWKPMRAAAILCALLAAAASASALAAAVPTDPVAFTEYVAAALRAQPLDGQAVTVTAPLNMSIGSFKGNLDRVYRFCRANADDCQREVDRYAQALAGIVKEMSAPPDKAGVRLAVRQQAYLDQLTAPGVKPPQSWPLAGDLVVVPMLDLARTTRSLGEPDFKKLDLEPDGVYRLGEANLNATLKPLMSQARVAKRGQIGQLAGDPYESSRLALHDSWAPLVEAQGGVLIAVAPAKDAVFYIGEDTPQAIDALRAFARQVIVKVPNPLSTTLLRWTKAGWEPVP